MAELNEKTNKQTSKHPTKDQIEAWKTEHGDVYKFSYDEKIVIMRAPKLADLERAMASDPKKKKGFNFNRSILNNCALYKDDGIDNNDKILTGLFAKMDEMIEIAEVEMEKL